MPKYKVHFEGYCLVEANSAEEAKYMAEDGDEYYAEKVFFEAERIYNEE